MMKPQNSQKLKHKSEDEVVVRDELSQPEKSIKSEIQIEHQNPNQNQVTIASFNDADSDLDSPHHLSEVPIKYSLSPLEVLVAIKDHIFHNHHNTLDSLPDQAAQVENEGQQHSNDSSLPDISTPSATRSMSSSTSTSQQYLSVADNKVLTGVLGKEKQNPVNHNSVSIVPVSKKRSPDGYNWRKYGEKKLKSPEGSRSYYRCTHCNCQAKKIECSDRNNLVIDTIYKSQHNHDPPNKVNHSPKIRPPAIIGHSKTSNSSTGPNNAVASFSLKTYAERRSSASSSKEQCRDGSDDKSEINVVDDDSDTDTDTDTDTDEVELRKRLKRRSDPDYAKALSKGGKKPKLIVREAGDVVISGDGYRWRKYGQKMVKGNPHPRNYYRCTSAGCPVRKQIERAVDDPIAAIITYKGVHDHDMPVPKTRQSLPSALFAGTDVYSPVPLSSLQVKSVNNFRIKYTQPNGSGHSRQSEE